MQQESPVRPTYHQDDEIDLFELFENIWSQKWLVAMVTAVALIAGGAFAFLSTPTYQAAAQLQAPPVPALKELKVLHNYTGTTPDTLLQEYLHVLASNEFKLVFLAGMPEALQQEIGREANLEYQLKQLNERFILSLPQDQKNASLLAVPEAKFTGSTPLAASSALQDYLKRATAHLVAKLHTDFLASQSAEIRRIDERIQLALDTEKLKRETRITQLEEKHRLAIQQVQDQLKARKFQYAQTLNDRIQRLQDALEIATRLNIKRPSTLSQMGQRSNSRVEINAEIRASQDPLYLRGTDFLSAELAQLKARSDSFIDDAQVRELEAKLVELEINREIELLKARESDAEFSQEIQSLKAQRMNLQAERFPENLELTFVSGQVVADPSPIKPKKALILALSVVLGGMLGVMIALIRSAIRNRQAKAAAGKEI